MAGSNLPGRKIEGADAQLYNADLAPTVPEARSWTWVSIAALWVMVAYAVRDHD